MRVLFSVLAAGLILCTAADPGAMAQGRPRAVIYREANFRGDQRVLEGEVRDFNAIGLNDRISSIRIDSGTWEFCEDTNFRGRCIRVSSDERDLAGSSLDDRLSSARPVADRDDRGFGGPGNNRGGFDRGDRGGPRDDRRGGGVTLYRDVGYGGDSLELSDTVEDFRSIRFNDAASSIRIGSGTWQFCSDAGFGGRCITADRDVPSLVPMGLNDAISSMRRVR